MAENDQNNNEEQKRSDQEQPQEEIIVEEGPAEEKQGSTEKEKEEAKKKKKRFVFLAGALGGFIVLLLVVFSVIIFSEDESRYEELQTEPIAQNLEQEEEKLQTRLEDMISKAGVLYEQGKKQEALRLYDHIADFSKSISYYNLGVSRMKGDQCAEAIDAFKQAIDNEQHRTISAVNAAVCALRMNDEKVFEYYLDLAYAHLPEKSGTPMYPYLYALINFYKNNRFEVLATANEEDVRYYKPLHHTLNAYAFLEFGSFHKAIESFEKSDEDRNSFHIGLSYANTGEYEMARKHLQKSVNEGYYPLRSKLALSMMQLKLKEYNQAAGSVNDLRENHQDSKLAATYPIKVTLSPDLYDAEHFQKGFIARFKNNKRFAYKLLWHYAPYKVFNAGQTIEYIQKGSETINIEQSSNTQTYLQRSGQVSAVNEKLSEAIRDALDRKVTVANKKLQKLLEEYDRHSIVHYNLALSYAQMDDFVNAQKHFTRSYHLDSENYLAGIFALMSAEVIQKDVEKFESMMMENLRLEPRGEQRDFYETLLELRGSNISALLEWSEENEVTDQLKLALKVATYLNHDSQDRLQKYTQKLKTVTEDDLMSNLLHEYADNYKQPMKQFASNIQVFLNHTILPVSEIYHGAKLPLQTYVDFTNLAGRLYELKERLNEDMLFADDPRGMMYALSKVQILLKNYEHAYTLMNDLIDKYNMKDSATLFLGGVASVAADHHANASVLLRLASMNEANNFESRYGLGLLYQEMGNFEAAAIQYELIHGTNLTPKYFDFVIAKEPQVKGGA